MADRHVDGLFASAYDGRLDDGQRRRFDQHVGACDQCANAFADHCAAAEAVRSLPAARMPVAVRLPSHAPRPAHRSLPERLGLQSRLTLTLAGAAAAAVVVGGVTLAAVNSSHQTPSTAALGAGEARVASSSGTSASVSSSLALGAAQAQAPPAPTVAPIPAPTAFTNAVTVQRSGRQGEVLVLATTQQSFPAGSTLQVDARLVTWQLVGGSTAPAPQALAPPSGAATAQPNAGGAGAAPQSGHVASVADLALAPVVAEPVVNLLSAGVTAGSSARGPANSPSPIATGLPSGVPGFFQLTIPATAKPGDVLTIVATIPAGTPSSDDTQAVSAVLQITIS